MTDTVYIKIASLVRKRGLVVGCFNRPAPRHDLLAAEPLHLTWMYNGKVSWMRFGSSTFAAELVTIRRERGVIVANSLESNY